jgi:hypothetical protein
MRNITRIKRSVRAISPVISVLLMIAIAVIAALVAYAWVMGYMGNQTSKAGNGIQLQSFTTKGNLVLYVQNTGQGTVHLKYDGAVYVNDVLKNILLADDQNAKELDVIPIAEGQTVTLVIDYIPVPNEQLRIKIVTMEGSFIEGAGNAGQQTSQVAVAINKVGGSAASSVSPASGNYYVGQVIQLQATVGAGDIFTSWTSSSNIHLYGDDSATSIVAKVNGAGTITGAFTTATSPRLDFTTGTGQNIEVNKLSDPITVKRQQDGAGSITVTLATLSATGVFCDVNGNPLANNELVIDAQGGSAQFRYKDSTVGTYTLTASASGYTPDNTQITIKAAPAPTPTPTPTTSTNPTPTTSTEPTPTPTTSTEPTPTPTTSTEPTPNVQVTFAVSPAGAGTVNPTGTQSYAPGTTVPIQAQANSGYTFSSWTYTGNIEITSSTSSSTNAKVNSEGTITANFIQSNSYKLVFNNGASQTLITGQASSAITVQRQSSSGSPRTSGGAITVALTATNGAFYSDQACINQISNITISNNQHTSSSFYFKASTTGTSTLTAAATGYQPVSTTFTINAVTQTIELRNSGFEGSGSSWDDNWDFWSNPPWGVGTDNYHTGTQSAKSTQSNQGAFSCNKLDASNAKYVTVTFWYSTYNTQSSNLQIRYSGVQTDTYSEGMWTNLGVNLGSPTNGWQQYSVTISDPSAMTSYFRFQFLSQGMSSSRAAIWIDDVVITMYA